MFDLKTRCIKLMIIMSSLDQTGLMFFMIDFEPISIFSKGIHVAMLMRLRRIIDCRLRSARVALFRYDRPLIRGSRNKACLKS